jgi:hypothetical protein
MPVFLLPTVQTTLNVTSGDISGSPGGTHSFTITDDTTQKLKVTDDDGTFDDGWGDTSQQIAPSSEVGNAGDLVASREYWTLSGSDGSNINLYVIMIPAQHWDPAKVYNTSNDFFFKTDQPLETGVTYTITSFNGNGAHAYNGDLICFLHSTMIETLTGPRPVQSIRPGDQVVTRDNGLQSVLWAGSKTASGLGHNAPVCIAAGHLGATRDLWVTQNHRLLLDDWRSGYFFGHDESLLHAKHMAGEPGIRIIPQRQMTVHHLLFERHEVIFANGCATESLYLGQMSRRSFDPGTLCEVQTYFPELIAQGAAAQPARPCLKAREARVLLAA